MSYSTASPPHHNFTFDPYQHFPVSKKELDDVDYVNWAMGLPCSALMVMFFVWLAYCVDTKRVKLTRSQWLIVGLAISLCGCSFSFFISVFNKRFVDSPACKFQGILSIYFGYSCLFWMACLSLNFRMMLVPRNGVFKKSSPAHLYKYFWIFSFGLPAILTAITYGMDAAGPNGNVCWFLLTEKWQLFRALMFHAIHCAVMLFNFILIVQIMCSLRSHYRGTAAGAQQGHVKQARVYIGILIVLGVAWIAIIPVDIQEATGNLTGGAFFYCICIHLASVHLQAMMVCLLEFVTLGLHKHLWAVMLGCWMGGTAPGKIDPRMSMENNDKDADDEDEDGSNADVPYDVVSRQDLEYQPPHPKLFMGSNTQVKPSPVLDAVADLHRGSHDMDRGGVTHIRMTHLQSNRKGTVPIEFSATTVTDSSSSSSSSSSSASTAVSSQGNSRASSAHPSQRSSVTTTPFAAPTGGGHTDEAHQPLLPP